MSVVTQFEKTGTLQKPGPIGRAVRLFLGIWITFVFFQLLDIGFLDAEKTDITVRVSLISWINGS
ncbi:MAG: hypothetical protein ACE5G1_13875 [bacterium]